MPFYLDTSALTKFIVDEAESDSLLRWNVEIDNDMVSSELVLTELPRAVRRRDSQLVGQAMELLGRTQLIALSSESLEVAGRLSPASLRTLDALHVACALSLGNELDGIVTYDRRMAEAAELSGIPTVVPV